MKRLLIALLVATVSLLTISFASFGNNSDKEVAELEAHLAELKETKGTLAPEELPPAERIASKSRMQTDYVAIVEFFDEWFNFCNDPHSEGNGQMYPYPDYVDSTTYLDPEYKAKGHSWDDFGKEFLEPRGIDYTADYAKALWDPLGYWGEYSTISGFADNYLYAAEPYLTGIDGSLDAEDYHYLVDVKYGYYIDPLHKTCGASQALKEAPNYASSSREFLIVADSTNGMRNVRALVELTVSSMGKVTVQNGWQDLYAEAVADGNTYRYETWTMKQDCQVEYGDEWWNYYPDWIYLQNNTQDTLKSRYDVEIRGNVFP